MTSIPDGLQPGTQGAVPDLGFACLAMVASFHGKPADAAALAHRFGRSDAAVDATTLLRAAKSIERIHPGSPTFLFR